MKIDKKLDPEKVFRALLKNVGLPQPESEHVFAPPRKWRFDYAWPAQKIALEVEGGIWIQGRHSRGAGFLKDMEKYNAAASLGWLVLRTTPEKLTLQETWWTIDKTLKLRAA